MHAHAHVHVRQGGLSLGARLQLLGVPYLIVEADARVGDSWRKRYPYLLLHDPVLRPYSTGRPQLTSYPVPPRTPTHYL